MSEPIFLISCIGELFISSTKTTSRTEYMVIMLRTAIYQLDEQKKVTQKQVDTLNYIYGILPLVDMKANLKNNSIKLNDSARTILEHKDLIKIAKVLICTLRVILFCTIKNFHLFSKLALCSRNIQYFLLQDITAIDELEIQICIHFNYYP